MSSFVNNVMPNCPSMIKSSSIGNNILCVCVCAEVLLGEGDNVNMLRGSEVGHEEAKPEHANQKLQVDKKGEAYLHQSMLVSRMSFRVHGGGTREWRRGMRRRN